MQASHVLVIVILSSLVTYLWRGFGVLLASRLDPNGEIFDWLNCVAYALLAGLMARVIFLPAGLLAETGLAERSLALAAGFVVFFLTGRKYFLATIISTLVFLLLVVLLTGSR